MAYQLPRFGTRERAGAWLWLFPASYAVHVAEELFAGEGFHRWLARVAGAPLGIELFVVANAIYMAAMILVVALVRARPRHAWLVAGLGALTAANALGHLAGSLLTRSYSPGSISGLLLWLPLGIAALAAAWRSLPHRATLLGAGLGLGAQAFVMITALLAIHG